MSEERRKCIINYYDTPEKGFFIRYGDIEYTNEENRPYTACKAIIEKLDGQVITVNPGAVQFVEK